MEVFLIPNLEIRKEWANAVAVMRDQEVTDRLLKDSKDLLNATVKGDEDAVAKALDESHIHVSSNRSYNNEDVLHSAIYLAYIYALNKYTVIKEMTTGKGFADVVFIHFVRNLPVMIIELKHNKCAESALNQIKENKDQKAISLFCRRQLLSTLRAYSVGKIAFNPKVYETRVN